MAKTDKKRLRAAWLQVHKWIGLTLAVLIVPISLTGAALVWHDWLDSKVEPHRHAVLGSPALPPSAYAAAARAALTSEDRIASLRFDPGGRPVTIVASKPALAGASRPERTNVWLDPRDARVVDKASANSGVLQVMHVLHGSLMWPGWGRTIVGWVGVAMLISSISGIWLWWPLSGSVASGFRWRRRNTMNANLHYLAGFWVMIPLAMLSFTGAWISFPKVFGMFEARPGPSQEERAKAMRARPLASTATSVDAVAKLARPYATGPLTTISWPTEQKGEWKLSYERPGGPAEVVVTDAGQQVDPPKPPQPETLARTMRRLHDGTGMGRVWQTVIFVAGIIPALLSVTGIIIWLRSRRPRARSKAFKGSGRLQAAE